MSPFVRWVNRHERLVAYVYLGLVAFSAIAMVLMFALLRSQNARLHQQDRRIKALVRRNSRNVADVHSALCTLRADFANRIVAAGNQLQRSLTFLRAHPQGVDGITRALVLASIKSEQLILSGQVRTFAALRGLNCARGP